MSSTADRVRDLIQQSSLNQHDFAVRIGLDDSKLSKSLSGTRRFSSLDLARIAELCTVTVDWLVTGADPPLAMAARTTGGSSRTAARKARTLSTLRSDMATLGYAQPWHPMTVDPGQGTYTQQGERLAEAALERVGNDDQQGQLADLVEGLFGADVAVAELGDHFDGLATSAEDVKLILLATSHVPARQRFTLAHELGHLLAGDDQGVHLDPDVYDSSRRSDPTEMRANAFAGAFLMPAPALRRTVQSGLSTETFARLACDLTVSPAALAYRLLNLRLIDAGTCDQLRAVTMVRAASLAGCGDEFARLVTAASTPRPPGLLVRDTFAAYEAGAATLRPYANLLGLDVDSLRDALETESEVPEPP